MNICHKRGEVRDDGKIFWTYQKGYKNGERWITKESFDKWINVERNNQKKRRIEKSELIKQELKAWRLANKDKWNAIRNRYRKKKRTNDSVYLLKDRVRNLTTQAFRINGYSKKSRTHELLGCSWEFLKNYIEQRFKDGMTWGNRSKWHIDHIIPLSSANSEKELYKLFHYTNLQPLWAIENLQKKNKINKQLTFA